MTVSSAARNATRSRPLVADGGHPPSAKTGGQSSNRIVLYAAACMSFPLAAIGNAVYGPGGEFVGLLAFVAYAVVTRPGESDDE